MLDRYKAYCSVLKGKQIMEQYVNAFELKESMDKYINYKGEKDNFWVYNTTKIMMDRDEYRTHAHNSADYISGTYSYSLYLHKIKDMVIFVAPIICTGYGDNYNYNICKYFKYKFNKLGFNTFEIDNRKIPFGSFGPYCTMKTKILITPDKSDEDLQQLLFFIEKLNSYIINKNISVWDNTRSILSNVDPNFTEYVKKSIVCC